MEIVKNVVGITLAESFIRLKNETKKKSAVLKRRERSINVCIRLFQTK